MVFISFDNQNNLISYQLVHGTFLNYREDQLVHITGKPGNISVLPKRAEIQGEFITGLQLTSSRYARGFSEWKKDRS